MPSIEFVIPGCPVPKQRPRRARNGAWYTPARTKKYEAAVAMIAANLNVRPATGPIRMMVDIYWPDRRRRDLDNAAKSIADALNGITYVDDSQIKELTLRAHLDRAYPRAVVRLETIEAEQ